MLVDMVLYIIERSQEFTTALSQHLNITFISLGISILLGLVLGVIATRIAWLRSALLTVGNIGRTIPSLAVLALALPILGIGTPPTILALVFIGTLPILINTTVGIEQVDESTKEAARGMGMNDLQVLLRVEIPIASAVIMAGVRTAAVIVVASATLAAFIGGGGLGDLILRGHALNRDHIMLAGAIPATLLAFYFEEMFGRLQTWVTPKGLKLELIKDLAPRSELLSLLASVAIMPLIFGALLPWEAFRSEAGARVVITGLHEAYRMIGIPVLLLGLLATLWPQRPTESPGFLNTMMTAGAGVAGLIWMVVGALIVLPDLTAGRSLQFGFTLQIIAVAAIAAITVVEAVLGQRFGKRPVVETGKPVASPAA
ncbi:MAG TPA: ABC transporter permease [Anaerolineales bacterium]